MPLTKHTVVMKKQSRIVHANDQYVRFFAWGYGVEILELPQSVWLDMVRPLKITVTIQPGEQTPK